MKKLVLAFICAIGVSGVAFGQGQIAWATAAASIDAQTNGTVYSPLFGGGAANGAQGNIFARSVTPYGFDLLYQPYTGSVSTDTNVWDGTWTGLPQLTATNSSFAHTIAPITSGTVTVTALDTTQSVVFVGWSANLGSTWLQVSNNLANWATVGPSIVGPAYFGESMIGYIQGTTSPAPGASVFGGDGVTPGANGLAILSPNMQLYLLPVPEPGTLALAGLGGLSLLLFRRQRK